MYKTLALALAATGLALGTAATAQDRPERHDRSADITRADAEARAANRFARMDANRDGVLDEADREARQRARFGRMDTDGDGALTFAEMQAARETRQAMREEWRGERGHRMGRRSGMRAMMMERADTDNDDAISQGEFAAAALARFERLDANGDGIVTAEERRNRRGERGRTRG